MFLIQNILVHRDILQEEFVCNLSVCKGACCVEGDFGAPLDEEEKEMITKAVKDLYPLMDHESKKIIDQKGMWRYYPEISSDGTPLRQDGSCVYLLSDHLGIARCGFELLFDQGLYDFKKPISCHLYPIRVSKEEEISFEALNYDRWEICQSACSLGNKMTIPLYQFCRESIVRKYGETFYNELEEIAKDLVDK